MATTLRTFLNRTLRTLGEEVIPNSVTTLTEDYHLLLLNIFNHIKEELEDAHNWRSLRTKHTVTVAADALSGTVTSATERSRLLRISDARNSRVIPMVFDVTDAVNPDPLSEMDLAALIRHDEINPDQRASDSPTWFALDNAAEDVVDLLVWQRPSTERTISVYTITPQARLDEDDLDENIDVPVRAIELGVLWYAFEERGEELGTRTLFSEDRYRQALSDAIMRDSAEQGDVPELVPV